MTWNEIGDKIQGTTDEQRDQTAHFREPYDTDAEIIPVDVVFAEEDLVALDGETRVKKGDPFLA